jgi:hypothetical protein
MTAGFSNPVERFILELFLDWQYDSLVDRLIPNEFKD